MKEGVRVDDSRTDALTPQLLLGNFRFHLGGGGGGVSRQTERERERERGGGGGREEGRGTDRQAETEAMMWTDILLKQKNIRV